MSFFANLSLKKKLIGGFLLCSFILIVVGGKSIFNINSTNTSIKSVANENLPLLINAEKLQILALTHRRYEKDFFLNIGKADKQQGYLKKFRKTSETTIDTIDQLISLTNNNPIVTEELKKALQVSKKSYNNYVSGFVALTTKVLADPNLVPQEANNLMKPIKEDIYQFENGVKQLGIAAREIINDEMSLLVEQGSSSRSLIFVFLIIGVIASVGLGFLISRSIIHSVSTVTAGLKDIAQGEGDLTKRIIVNSSDEIGKQAEWFNLFIEKLQDIIKEVAGSVDVLSLSSNNLSTVASQLSGNSKETLDRSSAVSSAAEEMSSTMDSVSAAMEESSDNIGMVSSATEEMTSTVSEIAQNAAKAKNISEVAVEKSAQTTTKMSALGDAATKISKVTETITEISEQTNLLALNATIEAARAGDVGKGFAVVANEIKELARQTAEATVDIKSQIDNMQSTTDGTINDITQIGDVINEIDEMITTIAAAVEQQSASASEIAENISQASTGVTEVNENVAQSSATSSDITKEMAEIHIGSGEINRGSMEINKSAGDLSGLANQLNELVGRFKTG